MRRIETTTETQERKYVAEVRCDICCALGGASVYDLATDWDDDLSSTDESAIWSRRGYTDPDGGESTTTTADICNDCFEEHVVPFLESLGVKMRVKEIEW